MIRRVVGQLQRPAGGFYTEEVRQDGVCRGSGASPYPLPDEEGKKNHTPTLPHICCRNGEGLLNANICAKFRRTGGGADGNRREDSDTAGVLIRGGSGGDAAGSFGAAVRLGRGVRRLAGGAGESREGYSQAGAAGLEAAAAG